MFGLLKREPKKKVQSSKYKQVAVRPSTHKKLVEISDKRNRTIVDVVEELVGA